MSTNNPVFVSPLHADKDDLEMINGEPIISKLPTGNGTYLFTKNKVFLDGAPLPELPPTTKSIWDGTNTPEKQSSPVKVFGDRVLIRLDATLEQYKESSIIIPDVMLEKPQTGVVIAIGKKVEEVQVGDKIHFGKFSGHEIELELDGLKECLILCKEDDILLAING